MYRLSIIIPAPGGVDFSFTQTPSAVEETLVSVLENRPDHCEVQLACDAAYSDPYDLKDEVEFVTLDTETGSAADWPTLANRALQSARGRFVHVLMPGVLVTAGWERDACDYLGRASDVVAGVTPRVDYRSGKHTVGVELTSHGDRRLISGEPSASLNGEERVFGSCQLASFYRRRSLIQARGWNESVHPGIADVELALRLRAEGQRIDHREDSVVESTMRQVDNQGPRSFAITRDLERLHRTYAACGVVEKRGWLTGIGSLFHGSTLGRLAGRTGVVPMTSSLTVNATTSERPGDVDTTYSRAA